jgi:hypothetical protein
LYWAQAEQTKPECRLHATCHIISYQTLYETGQFSKKKKGQEIGSSQSEGPNLPEPVS